jgi:predicted RNase H-like nuclease (RuvC/YqgF family)
LEAKCVDVAKEQHQRIESLKAENRKLQAENEKLQVASQRQERHISQLQEMLLDKTTKIELLENETNRLHDQDIEQTFMILNLENRIKSLEEQMRRQEEGHKLRFVKYTSRHTTCLVPCVSIQLRGD